MKRKINAAKIFRYVALTFVVIIGLVAIIGTGGGGGGGGDGGGSNLTPTVDLTGQWEGSGEFRDACENYSCLWPKSLNPPNVTMNLVQDGSTVIGTVTLNLTDGEPQIENWTCNDLQGESAVIDGTLSGNRFTFIDEGNNFWELSATSDTLGGTFGFMYYTGDVCSSGLIGEDIVLQKAF